MPRRDDQSSSRGGSRSNNTNNPRGSRSGSNSRRTNAGEDEDDSVIDPSKPAWWNEQKKNERKSAERERHERIREENIQRKIAQGNVASYGQSAGRNNGGNGRGGNGNGGNGNGGRTEIQDARVGARGSTPRENSRDARKKSSDRGGAGVYQEYEYDPQLDVKEAQVQEAAYNSDVMDMHDDRLNRKQTAEEELQGQSLWDLGAYIIIVL